MAFAHLHMHTQYSLLDGASRIKPLVKRLKELGYTHAAITDHGVMYGVMDFYKACKQQGITPIIGCEMYLCRDRLEKRMESREYSHLVLLCENETGYHNLMYLVSAGFTEGYYYRPRIDYKLLQEHHEGLIALSGCLFGDLPKMLADNRRDDATLFARKMRDMMGPDHFYIEIQDHGLREQKALMPRLINLAHVNDIPIVCTNDCHYIYQEDAAAQEVLMCIQTGKTLKDENRMKMQTNQMYVKSEAEMRALFPKNPEAFDNAQKIADMCRLEFESGKLHLPAYPVPAPETPAEMLRRLCSEGLHQLYPGQADDPASEPCKRLAYELSVIEQMGYVDYFLIVWDFINYARENNIFVGPGRGSGAGSIVAYTLHITKLDPLKYNLLFERFLNPERMSMPDLDIDFCYERRQEVIDYVARKYGQDHVSQIITFGTMKAKAVVRDVARVLGLPYSVGDRVAKSIPAGLDVTLEKAYRESTELQQLVESDPEIRRLYEMSLTLEGLPRHASTHAAGVLITAKPVTEYVPLQVNDNAVTTQYPMGTLESLGLLKMDFLGLRTLTVIRDALAMMKQQGITMTPDDIPLDDSAVYEMISRGDTTGVFQLESGGMRQFLQAMKPSCFEDVIAAISLYRPGPMESIPRYIAGKNDPSTVTYKTPQLKPILDVTYGCMVYQEQVMQIVRDLAGYSLGRSDLMRRAMAKKKHDVMAQEREYFVNGMTDKNGTVLVDGCVRRGIAKDVAESIFDEMSSFASYAFNKSHAAAYAVVAVQTAWLKRHYPVPYMAALINSVMDNLPKAASYIQYCRGAGIAVLPPHVNNSSWAFTAEGEGIRFGLGGIKNVGHGAVELILKARQKSPFTDFTTFCERVQGDSMNKRAAEGLIMAGAFDGMGLNRAQLLGVYESLMDDANHKRKANVEGQMSLFDFGTPDTAAIYIPPLPQLPLGERLAMEREMTGVYISGHPLDSVRDLLKEGFTSSADVLQMAEGDGAAQYDGTWIRMGGILTAAKGRATKKGPLMGSGILEDLTGSTEIVVFPKVYERVAPLFAPDKLLLIEGRLSLREDEEPRLLADAVRPLNGETAAAARQRDKEIAEKKLALPKTEKVPHKAPETLPLSKVSGKPLTDAQIAKSAARKICVYLPNRVDLQKVKELCALYPGKDPVYIRPRSEGITLLLERALWIDAKPAFFDDIAAIQGAEAKEFWN